MNRIQLLLVALGLIAKAVLAALAVASLAGCGGLTPVPPGGEKDAPVGAVDGEKASYLLLLGIEKTGDKATDDKTFAASDKMLKGLRIERAGEQDKIVLVDLSGPGVIDTVNPRIFREKYKGRLKDALQTTAGGSKVYSVLTEALYATRTRHLKKEEQKPLPQTSLVVFSALRDTLSGPQADSYLMGQLAAFDKLGGNGAFYGMDAREALRWTHGFETMLHGRWHISTGPEADDVRLPRFGSND